VPKIRLSRFDGHRWNLQRQHAVRAIWRARRLGCLGDFIGLVCQPLPRPRP
jgi:hypothetical protein